MKTAFALLGLLLVASASALKPVSLRRQPFASSEFTASTAKEAVVSTTQNPFSALLSVGRALLDRGSGLDTKSAPRRALTLIGHADSSSTTELHDVLDVLAIGDGDYCYKRVFNGQFPSGEKSGDDSTATIAYIDSAGGIKECREGANCASKSMIFTSVLAKAIKLGPICKTEVLGYISSKKYNDCGPDGGVDTEAMTEAGVEAFCKDL